MASTQALQDAHVASVLAMITSVQPQFSRACSRHLHLCEPTRTEPLTQGLTISLP